MGDSCAASVPAPASKPKVVVILGATGAGKSRLAIDLAQHFPAEIVNADSMQVYEGLDVLTNKVPPEERKGVPHHLLGTINSNVDFTSRDFRDMAIPIIDSITSRKQLPIIVGGTNYYIQALVSSYLVDDLMDDGGEDVKASKSPPDFVGRASDSHKGSNDEAHNTSSPFDRLKEIDPVAANRLHPNDLRRIKRYLDIFHTTGSLPSKIFQGERSKVVGTFDLQVHERIAEWVRASVGATLYFLTGQKWGREDSFRYNCCFLWVDASLPVLYKYVEHRVDSMIDFGLLEEVAGFYDPKADYTRGLRQAIGVREFEKLFSTFPPNVKEAVTPGKEVTGCSPSSPSAETLAIHVDTNAHPTAEVKRAYRHQIAEIDKDSHKVLLNEAIKRMKANTCKLVRRQKRRINRLKTFFGWNLHQLDVAKALESSGSESHNMWKMSVVDPSVALVKTFLSGDGNAQNLKEIVENEVNPTHSVQVRDLWTQYICKPCGDRVLRGAHEWEQHKLGRSHRRQILRLKKFFDSRNNLQA